MSTKKENHCCERCREIRSISGSSNCVGTCPCHQPSPKEPEEEWEEVLIADAEKFIEGRTARMQNPQGAVVFYSGFTRAVKYLLPQFKKHYEQAKSQGAREALEEVKKEVSEIEKYPVSVFGEPWKGWEKDLQALAKSKGYDITNISAWYARWQEKLVKEDVISILQSNLKEK